MEEWLAARGEPGPDQGGDGEAGGGVDGHFGHGAGEPGTGGSSGLMPGMLTPRQLDRLAAARGPEFDRLFARLMIQHHRGALVMVAQLREDGGGIEPGVYRLSADIEADQEIEIRRMRDMLAGRFGGGL